MSCNKIVWTQPPSLLENETARVFPTPQFILQEPVILRFTEDTFMDELLNVLKTNPIRLAEYKVRKETWRGFQPAPQIEKAKTPSLVLQRLGIFPRSAPAVASPAAVATSSEDTELEKMPLKLYQPAHKRHYVVAGSLVCELSGLPDKEVAPGREERASFVLRRLLPPSDDAVNPEDDWEEYAWVAGPNGGVWQKVGEDPWQANEDEERLPMFSLYFAENDSRQRRLFAGVIPVGKRETYLAAPKSNGSATPGVTAKTSRKILLRKEVIEPWKSLIRRAGEAYKTLYDSNSLTGDDRLPSSAEKVKKLEIERGQIQTISWLILLDFAKYLKRYLKPLWAAVLDPSLRPELSDPMGKVFDVLESTQISHTRREDIRRRAVASGARVQLYSSAEFPYSLRAALAKYGAVSGSESSPNYELNEDLEEVLEKVEIAYNRSESTSRQEWPGFIYPLADPQHLKYVSVPVINPPVVLSEDEDKELPVSENGNVDDLLEQLDDFAVLIVRALDADDDAPTPAVPTAAVPPVDVSEGWFVIRCVYDRPACQPLFNQVLSDPTEPFQMAGFFDPDAPARPIRIGLPIDVTPAGLRKFDKNTAFVISNTLCGQIRRMKGLSFGDLVRSVLPWPLHKDLPGADGGPCKKGNTSFGMICSLSIPIITICALILLIIMVNLFDIIFRWLPYFIVCFPVPGLKSKK